MGALIFSLIISLAISFLIALFGFMFYDSAYGRKSEITCLAVTITLCAIVIISIPFSICSYEKLQSTCYIDKYSITKTTIEESIDNDKLSGLERIQLIELATEENSCLIQHQFDCKQWYGFLIDENVMRLKPINFD